MRKIFSFLAWCIIALNAYAGSGYYLIGEFNNWSFSSQWEMVEQGNNKYTLSNKYIYGNFKISTIYWSHQFAAGPEQSNCVFLNTSYELTEGDDRVNLENLQTSGPYDCTLITLDLSGTPKLTIEGTPGKSYEGMSFVSNGIAYTITNLEAKTIQTFEGTNRYSGNKVSGIVQLPDKVKYDFNGETFTLTEIGKYGFSNCTDLVMITLPSTIKKIDDYAFSGCNKIINFTLPESLTSIGGYAFSGCNKIVNFTLPESLTSIGSYAFNKCSSLTSIKIPAKVSEIGSGAFMNCEGISSIEIPAGVDVINDHTFCNCSSLSTISLPASVKSLGNSAFSGCSKLTNLDLPDKITELPQSVFDGCYSLESLTIPSSVTTIADGAFSNCYALQQIEIPASVSYIGDFAFQGCSALNHVSLPSTLSAINYATFSGCSSLKNITIPSSVTSIGNRAFSSSGLEEIVLPNTITEIGESVFSDCRNLTSFTAPSNWKAISKSMFSGCSSLTTLSLPEGLEIINQSAFSGCSGIKELSLPNSLLIIYDGAFQNCYEIEKVKFGSTLSYIGSDAFRSNSAMSRIEIFATTPPAILNTTFSYYDATLIVPDGTSAAYVGTTWGDFMKIIEFSHKDDNNGDPDYEGPLDFFLNKENKTATVASCEDGLTTVEIPSEVTFDGEKYTVTTIFTDVFAGKESLQTVILPNTITTIQHNAFESSGIVEIEIPESVTEFGVSIFRDCKNLNNVILPSNISRIPASMFDTCTSLTNINLPENVTEIGSSAFSECTGLTQITFPVTLQAIGEGSFSHCYGLEILELPESLEWLGKNAFWGSKVKTVTFNNSGTLILNEGTFGGCEELTKIICNSPIPPTSESELVFSYIVYENAQLIVLEEYFDIYGETIPWNQFSLFRNYETTHVKIGDLYYNLDDSNNTAEVTYETYLDQTNYQSLTGVVTIPETVVYSGNKYNVTSIGNSAFYGCYGLTGNLVIPNSVTSIGRYAFAWCDGLTSVEIPNSVTEIGYHAFYFCSGLTSINVDNENPSYKSEGGVLYSKNLQTIIQYPAGLSGNFIIPNSVTSIGDEAFYYCSGLTSVEIPNSVTSIGNSAFYGCYGLTGNLVIPNSVTEIGSYAFSECWSLTSIEIPNSITEIRQGVFSTCWSLTSIEIPNSVTSIGSWSFCYCSGLTSVEIPNSVTEIGENAFLNCSELTALYIGENVKSIGSGAFEGCQLLEEVVCAAIVPPTADEDVFSDSTYSYATLVVPDTAASLYRGSIPWGLFSNVEVTENVISFEYEGLSYTIISWENAFVRTKAGNWDNPGNLVSGDVIIPDTVEYLGKEYSVIEIGKYGFYECEDLTAITLPSTLRYIEEEAFYGCKGLTALDIPDGVSRIGDFAFRSCSGLRNISFGASLYYIGYYTFANCYSLVDLDLPNVITLGNRAFQDCTALEEVKIGANLNSFGEAAFGGCDKLQNINVVPENHSFTSVDGVVFSKDLTTIVAYCGGKQGSYEIPESTVRVGKYAFAWCQGLTEVSVPAGVEVLEICAFNNSLNLKEVHLNEGLISIGKYAFNFCHSLTEIRIPNSVVSIDANAFSYCNLTELSIGSGVESIGEDAFYDNDNLSVINCFAKVPPIIQYNTFEDYDHPVLHVLQGCDDTYREAPYWKNFNIIADLSTGMNGIDTVIDNSYYINIFTLNGVCLKHDATQEDIDALAPGIYIIGGKKVIVR